MAISQMNNHLRTYIEDGIKQKIRIDNMIADYKEQEYKTRERIIDENELKKKLQDENIDPEKINLIDERIKRDEVILSRVQNIVNSSKEDLTGLVLRMNAHLEELTQMELTTGGFITHAIGIDKNAELDKENMIVKFQPDGHIEIPIAARISKWKDSSQLTIKKIKK